MTVIFAVVVIVVSCVIYVFYPRMNRWLLARELKKLGLPVPDGAPKHVESLLRPPPAAHLAAMDAECASLRALTAELQADLDRMIRIASEYFAIIAAIEKQRDNYKHLWLEQGREHAVGQAHYERALIEARQIAMRAIDLLNEDRKKAGLPLIKSPMEIMAPPIGTVKAFRDKIEAHIAAAPPEVDGSGAQVRLGPPTLSPRPKEDA